MRERKGRIEGRRKEVREVNSYLLSFCCDIQIWSCEATLLVDNVYLRTTCAVISLIYTRPLIQLNIKQIHVQIRKWKYLCKNLVGKEGEGICSKEVYYCKLMVHAIGFSHWVLIHSYQECTLKHDTVHVLNLPRL